MHSDAGMLKLQQMTVWRFFETECIMTVCGWRGTDRSVITTAAAERRKSVSN